MIRLIFIFPILLGILLLSGSFVLFRRETLNPRTFAIAVTLSGLVVISPVIYMLLDTVKGLFGFVYTFVFGFGLAILALIALVVYLLLIVGALREESRAAWQEIALLRAESSNTSRDVDPDTEE